MNERPRTVIKEEKPTLYKLKRLSNQSLFDDDEQYRSRMYDLIEDPFR